ncbi:Hydrolase [Seminavis robusta]|uniref:Hydrolase n=1 Tax=Seminavis robusta TaxID=568900 RepID=A0A9N8H4X1_9STRA|nr:Hydrolase [Seminavis robusta]|eukprot:Sro97_g049900.1 Hydrolase (561) ;mRNA; f:35056-36738
MKNPFEAEAATPETLHTCTSSTAHEDVDVDVDVDDENLMPAKQLEFLLTPDEWYALGERVAYDLQANKITTDQATSIEDTSSSSVVKVFRRVVKEDNNQDEDDDDEEEEDLQRWMTFLPSDPEGSFAFQAVEQALSLSTSTCTSTSATRSTRQKKEKETQEHKGRCDTESTEASLDSQNLIHVHGCVGVEGEETMMSSSDHALPLPRLYLDYVGMGDSDSIHTTSSHHHHHQPSLTKQRADLVEALWEEQGIKRTVVVSAGESSSLVIMELLQRQRNRLAAGSPFPKLLHVLSLNGRYVAKTRQINQLPTVTQLLRSDRMGPKLAHKAQRSDFTIAHCLGPHLRGCSAKNKQLKKQIYSVVRRHNGTSSQLLDMARIVDDHLDRQHRYRWHLPHLLKVFAVDQGITFHLATTNSKKASQQIQLVQRQLDDYELTDIPHVRYDKFEAASTTAFLFDTSAVEGFVTAIRQLQQADIPMSYNAIRKNKCAHDDGQLILWRRSFGEDEFDELDEEPHDNDSYLDDDDHDHDEDDHLATQSLDTRLETEIVFDNSEMDDDEFDLF